MKLLFRLFLSLSFLLLTGLGYTHTHSYQELNYYSPTTAPHQSDYRVFGNILNSTLTDIKHVLPGAEKRDDIIYEEESENENVESNLLKKHSKTSTYFTAFYPWASAIFCNYLKNHGPHSTHLSCYSSHRYILFQVIRV